MHVNLNYYVFVVFYGFSAASKIPLNQLAKMSTAVSLTSSTSATGAGSASMSHAGDVSATVTSISEVQPLTNIFVPLETIQPGNSTIVVISEY